MVGHLLEYHPGVEALKQLVDGGELGDMRYVYSNRLNLGVLRPDENALWSLGAHDVSVILRLAGEEPNECRAVGESYMQEGIEDVVFCFLRFPSGLAAHMHLSWLDPHKERRFTVVGSKKMATFDDMELERKLTVYDKGFDENWSSYGEYIARSGDTFSPRVPNDEPLRRGVRALRRARARRRRAALGGEAGLRVVRVLEALQQSLRESSRAAGSDRAPRLPRRRVGCGSDVRLGRRLRASAGRARPGRPRLQRRAAASSPGRRGWRRRLGRRGRGRAGGRGARRRLRRGRPGARARADLDRRGQRGRSGRVGRERRADRRARAAADQRLHHRLDRGGGRRVRRSRRDHDQRPDGGPPRARPGAARPDAAARLPDRRRRGAAAGGRGRRGGVRRRGRGGDRATSRPARW